MASDSRAGNSLMKRRADNPDPDPTEDEYSQFEVQRENNLLGMTSTGIGGSRSKKGRIEPDPWKGTDPQVNSDAGHEYDVFLSFRGPDNRDTFTDCLFHGLKDAGIRTFRDDEELHVGEEIGRTLMRAINQSRISLPIFSKNYASSKWCLMEVAEMVKRLGESKYMILPVFLDVTPNEVQHQTESYAEAFSRHEKKYELATVQEWRGALHKVVQLKGLELQKEANGKHGQFIKLVLARVLNILKKGHLNVKEILIGVGDRAKVVKRLLDVGGDSVKIVGIWGMGGIGKTTLAKVVYNQVLDQFESSCFLNDIRETERSKGLPHLQSKLVSGILNEACIDFANVDEGIQHLKGRLGGKKAIILLDDVVHVGQLKDLAGSLAWFGPGSRIIITTRDKDVLLKFEVSNIYEVMPLSEDQAFELFCKHAFLKGSPAPDIINLARKIVRATGMLPLTLKVIGSSLCIEIKCKATWKETLKKLLMAKPEKDVQDRLKISYDGLSFTEKQIFLDIACMFIGMDSRAASSMWDDCDWFPRTGIQILVLKSLIKIINGTEFWMHDQLRDLGREIVEAENYRQPGSRSRLWRPHEATRVLNRKEGTAEVEAITLQHFPFGLVFVSDQFRNLSNLRILNINFGVSLLGDFEGLLADLRWLSWHFCIILPTNLDMKNLIVLDLSYSHVSEDWAGWSLIKVAVKLKVLNLTCCASLKKTPDFSEFPALERLILRSCFGLRSIDPSIEQLTSLVSLDTEGSWRVTVLPRLGSMDSLTELIWTGSFPTDYKKTLSEPTLPSSLIILRFERLLIQAFPDLEHLSKLEELYLKCEEVRSLRGLHGLISLKSMKIECTLLTHLKGLEMLEQLSELKIRKAPIRRLPSLSKLKRLTDITLEWCEQLCQVNGLGESLERVTMRWCTKLVKLPGLSKLRKVRGLGDLESLEVLKIDPCHLPADLPSISKLRRLGTIFVSSKSISEIVGLEELDNLERFTVMWVPAELPDLSKLRKLQYLTISWCKNITGIRGLEDLETLKSVEILCCGRLENLPNMSRLRRLRMLRIVGLSKPTEVVGLEELDNLVTLEISACGGIEKLPDLSKLRGLHTLIIKLCSKISEVGGLGDLESLHHLDISGCTELQSPLNMSKLRKLKTLKLRGLSKSPEIVGLEELDNLEHTEMTGLSPISSILGLDTMRKPGPGDHPTKTWPRRGRKGINPDRTCQICRT